MSIAFIFGALGVCANMLIYQQKTGKNLLLFKLASDLLWSVHYCLQGAYTGMCIAIIAMLRSLVFLKQAKDDKRSGIWLLIFWACGILSTVITWNGPMSLLPALSSAMAIFSFWRSEPKLTRWLVYPISLCMFSYDIGVGSSMGIVNEILTLCSTSFAIFKNRKAKSN